MTKSETQSNSNKPTRVQILPLVVLLALLSVFIWGLRHNHHEIQSPLIGHPVPAFQVQSLLNRQILITQEIFKNRVSVLQVFASWCGICLQEMPELQQIAKNSQTSVQWVGLSYQDDPRNIEQALQQWGNPFQQILYDTTDQLALDLGVYGTPETFLLDQQGIIRDKIVGPITLQVWQERLLPEILSLQKNN